MDNDVKIPHRLKIAGVYYTVIIQAMADQGNILFGRGIITVKDELCQDKAEEALCHEIVEAWNEAYELKLSHTKIQTLGSALHQLEKDNKLSFYEGK